MKVAVVIVNLGTPSELTLKSVKSFLLQFLLDPLVIDIPYLFRQILVRFFIVPFRSKKSLAAYKKVWTDEGSPLFIESKKLRDKLQVSLGDKAHVFLAMRYGSPSVKSVLTEINYQLFDKIILMPLYPQYSWSTVRSALREYSKVKRQLSIKGKTKVIDAYYDKPKYIRALTDSMDDYVSDYDHVLFSFHSLPISQIIKQDQSSQCFTERCCEGSEGCQRHCYRAQCIATFQLVAEQLSLLPENCSLSFQSRVGKKWLSPFTDETIISLAQSGVKKLAVVCPGFATDCLETLEEIDIECKNLFLTHGGEEFKFIPCLNDSDFAIEAYKKIIEPSL